MHRIVRVIGPRGEHYRLSAEQIVHWHTSNDEIPCVYIQTTSGVLMIPEENGQVDKQLRSAFFDCSPEGDLERETALAHFKFEPGVIKPAYPKP